MKLSWFTYSWIVDFFQTFSRLSLVHLVEKSILAHKKKAFKRVSSYRTQYE